MCFSHQVLLPALGWGTCRLPPHFHTHHVPRVRLADAARAASFPIFFEFDFLFLRSTLDRIRLPQYGPLDPSSLGPSWMLTEWQIALLNYFDESWVKESNANTKAN